MHAAEGMYAVVYALEPGITAKQKRKIKNWNITFISVCMYLCVCAYVRFESFNAYICVRTQTHIPFHLTGVPMYTSDTGARQTEHGHVRAIVIVAISFSHSRAFHSSTKPLVQYFLVLHVDTQDRDRCRCCRHRRHCRRTPHLSYVLFYSVLSYRLCSLPMSSIEQRFRIWCVLMFSVLFMFCFRFCFWDVV